MPVVYRCRRCGYILYVFDKVGNPYGLHTPGQIRSMYGGFCPRCGTPLGKPSLEDIVVKPGGAKELQRVLEEMWSQSRLHNILYVSRREKAIA